MYKLGQFVEGEWMEYSHAAVFERRAMKDGTARLEAGVPAGDVAVIRQLTRYMEPPFEILYVLLVSRGKGDLIGRYQSPPIERAHLDAFLSRYEGYFKSDGRFTLWIYTPQSMLVWDKHNLLYAYGPVSDFENALRSMGFTPGRLSIPVPHAHNYHPECDADAGAILAHFEWQRSELRPGDDD
jgi:hypothetical protein